MDYLQKNKEALWPELRKLWEDCRRQNLRHLDGRFWQFHRG
jgi:hypothetical protein